MKIKKTIFVCAQCGCQQPKWMGRCPECDAWNSFSEESVAATQSSNNASGRTQSKNNNAPTPITQIEMRPQPRIFCGLPELDRVVGGGLVRGSMILLSGDPGVGKSTLLLQALHGLACQGYKVLYASGEESNEQIKLRAERLGTLNPNILISNETSLDTILEASDSLKPDVLVVDSIQTVSSADLSAGPGAVSQVRDCTSRLMNHAKSKDIITLIIGHVTKEGHIAGPKALEHLVDTVLYLEGDATSGHRILRAVKNRFGSTGEIGVFAMHMNGLKDVANPSALFLEGHRAGVAGSAVAVSVEGTRPLLVEIQSLVGRTSFSVPRRTVTGLDQNRFSILIAVLEKRAGLHLATNDIYANVAGGLKIFEPALDLALAAAVASSLFEKPLAGRFAFFGEVGLSGEIRATSHAALRVQEALKLGFDRIYLPASNFKQERKILVDLAMRGEREIQLFPVESVQEVVALDRL